MIVSDEIHSPDVLRGAEMTPILSVPGAADHAIALTSAGKAWDPAGLKCALVIAEAPRRSTLTRLHRTPVGG